MSTPLNPFWPRERHAKRRPGLVIRAKLKEALRAEFARQDFLEVETGIVQVSPGNETHLHAFEAHWVDAKGDYATGYLHTSPEFAMKKLLVAGEERIFQFAPVFRAREASRLHAPEFTMLEWYRANEDYTVLMADCAAMLRLAAEVGGRREFRFRGFTCDAFAEPERLSVSDAFQRYTGIDLWAMYSAWNYGEWDAVRNRWVSTLVPFREAAQGLGIRTADDDTWSDIFSRIVTEKIEPQLGIGRATILDRYPISEAALARPTHGNEDVAERFELYVCGVELANAFGELTDAGEQRRRFTADMAEKQRLYGVTYPLDEDFLTALAYMPPASGAALGFDRLAMLAAGAESVHDVIFTPFPFGEST